jgi:hypothetical protein
MTGLVWRGDILSVHMWEVWGEGRLDGSVPQHTQQRGERWGELIEMCP